MTEAGAPVGPETARPSEPRSFFRSRWVKRPPGITELDPVALPAGFRAAGAAAGLKASAFTGPSPLDVGLLVSDEPATASAARFSPNALLGAPVIVSREASVDRLRAVVVNSGVSNVGDGARGLDTARATQGAAGGLLGLEAGQVGVASTGVIGEELPRAKLLAGVRAAAGALGSDARGLSEAILTTDRAPKRACLEVSLPSGSVRLAAQAKGAGMISPRFATMLCFVETDAALGPDTADLLLGVCVKRSFGRISVDGQLSPSDTVFCLASGASGVRVEPETDDERMLGLALDALLRQLALDMVADGEGATRVGRLVVRGAAGAAEAVGRAVANSPLVKCALHGADPNFGRVLQAAGQAVAALDENSPGTLLAADPPGAALVADLEVEGHRLFSGGAAVDLDPPERAELEDSMTGPEVEYVLDLPGRGGEAELFFSDLSPAYVELNSEYTT